MRYLLGFLYAVAAFVVTLVAGALVVGGIAAQFGASPRESGPAIALAFVKGLAFFAAYLGWRKATAAKTRPERGGEEHSQAD